MGWETAKRSVDFLFHNAEKATIQEGKTVEIGFWGGEPLLEWELLKRITLYAKKTKPPSVNLMFGGTTNGTLLTPDKFAFLDEHKIFFMVSIDGQEKSHNLYRKFHDGRGSHSVVMKNLESILKKWPFYRARLSPSVETVPDFFENMKYLFDFGFEYVMFSPVYEGNWTPEVWKTYEDQCKLVVDYMVSEKAKGRNLKVEHFESYKGSDNSKWPCGAGRFYAGIDIDGAIYPCHRFNKFNDMRPWTEKEVCIGHVDVGITKPDFRKLFTTDWKPECGECPRLKDTPCHGGCYAVNFDFTGKINTPHLGLCSYVEMQRNVSKYLEEKLPSPPQQGTRGCICYNMCYAEGTDQEITHRDKSNDMTCVCYNAQYNGPLDEKIARRLI
jgi:uncharacterized protein